ncbi:hypothetical protein HK405_001907, partial [Cladochytrium tenue]
VGWGGALGEYVWMDVREALAMTRPKAVAAGLAASAADYDAAVERYRREAVQLRASWNWYLACARRPPALEAAAEAAVEDGGPMRRQI